MVKLTDFKLTERTIAIIKRGGRILLRKKVGPSNDPYWYIGALTNIAGGPDAVNWSHKHSALPFFNLKWAFTIAPLYNCNVVVVYPKKKVVPQNVSAEPKILTWEEMEESIKEFLKRKSEREAKKSLTEALR